jgi:hypothetical protein
MVLHLERRQDAGGWKTSLGLTDIDRPTVHSGRGLVQLDHPFLVARMEFDDEGGEPRMYDATGRRVQMAGERERKMLGLASSLRNRTWDADVLGSRTPPGRPDSGSRRLTAGLTAEAGGRDNRRQQLEQRYGRPTGRVGRLDRFASAAGGTTEEVLVDPDAELPVEVNIVEDGALMSRVQVSYESNSTVGFVRRHVRSEQVADRASGMRMVTDVELANLTVTAGGGR